MSAAEQSPYRIPVLIALATGMRRGEVVGLRWEDFDPQRRVLTVRRSVCQITGSVQVKQPKTGRSRVVVIPQLVVDQLLAHQKEQNESKKLFPNGDFEWICTDAEGKRWTPEALTKGFARLRRSIGLDVTFHGLRHTQATMLIMSGVPVKVVSERLGHANVSVTQDIYAHVLPHMQELAADVIGGILGKKPDESGDTSG